MAYQTITVRRDGPVERLVFNRPTVRNAFNEELIGELTSWARAAASATDIRCVVISGAGPVFCAGADLAWMARVAAFSHDENVRDARRAVEMFEALDRLPMAVIGRIHGAALGGGAGVAAVCDIVVAESDTVFGFTETKLGIVPAVVSPFVVRKIGPSAARHLFVAGARFSAAHAREIGLVHAVVDGVELDDRVNQYVREVLTSGPQAIAAAKTLLRDIDGATVGEAGAITSETLARQRSSDEGREGLQAFLEKRRPAWSQPH